MDFMSAYLAGWSVLSLMCLIIGLGLMIAEMFTPGLGLMGMFGIIALIAAIVLSAHSLLDAIFTLAIIFVVLFIAGFIVYRSFTKGRLANSSIVLSDRIDSASTSLDDAEIQGIVDGDIGLARAVVPGKQGYSFVFHISLAKSLSGFRPPQRAE